MKKILYTIIRKWPVKIMLLIGLLVVMFGYFVTDIALSTGNETLIETDSTIYIDNYNYQQTFGTDPIIIVFEGENQTELLSIEALQVVNDLVKALENEEGIFYISSPTGIIEYATLQGLEQTQQALDEIGEGLITISENMLEMSVTNESVDPQTLLTTFDTLAEAQDTINTNATNQSESLSAMKVVVSDEITRLNDLNATLDPVQDEEQVQSITQTITILSNIETLYDQLILFNDNLASGAEQTSLALTEISQQLTTMFGTLSSVESNLNDLVVNLEGMGTSLKVLASRFDMFTNAFPSSGETLDNIVYQEGNINPMLSSFLIDENHMYISIILEESIGNEDIQNILDITEFTLSDTMYEDALISGKPILDYDIQSSMKVL